MRLCAPSGYAPGEILNETDLEISLSDIAFNGHIVSFKLLISLTYINLEVLIGYILEFCLKQET